jgi:tRNA pseudouridine13 synthase
MMHRYLTDDMPGIGGVLKTRPDDFVVDEVPLYDPIDEGDHTYFRVQKHGISTPEAVRRIARELRIPGTKIGYAGLKDARAVTSQVMSIEHIPPAQVLGLKITNITIPWARRHTNKIRLGHLRGNSFKIRVRELAPGAIEVARPIIDILLRRGAPSYFGRQRFGTKGDSHIVGKLILNGRRKEALDLILGNPNEQERDPAVRHARALYHEGNYQAALESFPHAFLTERRALGTLERSRGDHEAAFWTISRRLLRLYVSAYQSHLYNGLLEQRLDEIDQLRDGDMAYLHDRGAVFHVEDAAVEQPRCDRFEISPTAPLFGTRMPRATGKTGEAEEAVLEAEGIELEQFAIAKGLVCRGERRPARIPLQDIDVEEVENNDLLFQFMLPRGCYATVVLREILKGPEAPLVDDAPTSGDDGE